MTIIKAGSKKMIVNAKTGHRTGWHTFQKDNKVKFAWKQRICQTVYIVASGPDKGWYATS